MMELTVFNYKTNKIRVIMSNGEPHWVLKDLCDVLELPNPTIVASRLDEDEVTKFNLGGQYGETNIVNEKCEIKKIFDANYEKVNAYHITVWKYEYPELQYGE